MLLASYRSTRPGLQGLANRVIRLRLGGLYSHSEIVFEPGDRVDELMPDHSAERVAGTLWAASSVALERLPQTSPRRAGEMGGVRFKRIAFAPDLWDLEPLPGDALAAAVWFVAHEGALYDWRLIAKSVAWCMPEQADRFTCSEAAAAAAQFPEAWRFDPCNLRAAVRRLSMGG
jgi:hypothetical protein